MSVEEIHDRNDTFGRTQLWNELIEGVYGPRKGGARIIIDAENAATGCGKTGLAVSLASLLSKAFGYELQEEDLTLSGKEYLKRWKAHPGSEQPSVIVLDELSGAGAGDSRRAMSNQSVNLGRSWQLMRKKRVVTICTLPHWSDADKRMRRFADFRLWALQKPIGYFRSYRVGATFGRGDTRTYRLDDGRIRFPNMDYHENEMYQYLSKRKDDLLDASTFDADDLVEDDDEEEQNTGNGAPEKVKNEARRLRMEGKELKEIAEAIDNNPRTGEPYDAGTISRWTAQFKPGQSPVSGGAD